MSLVFLEANPFASRLHVLRPLVAAAASLKESVLIVHPRRVEDDHWREWRQSLPENARLVRVRWVRRMERPAKSHALRLAVLLLKTQRTSKRRDSVCLTALDDYLLASLACLPILWLFRLRGIRVDVIKYRVLDVFEPPTRPRPTCIKFATNLVLAVTGARLIVFDERFASQRVHVLPDPWSGDFGRTDRVSARERLGLKNSPVVGLIGYQDARKGFELAVSALLSLSTTGWQGQCLILGGVADIFQDALGSLKRAYGPSLVHQKSFVPDDALTDYFAACDVIWLPYRPSFTASSGVLARAAASGVPVVATDAGLIAHRVRKHQLGAVATDEESFARATLALLRGGGGFDMHAASSWARNCHESRTYDAARELYGEAN